MGSSLLSFIEHLAELEFHFVRYRYLVFEHKYSNRVMAHGDVVVMVYRIKDLWA